MQHPRVTACVTSVTQAPSVNPVFLSAHPVRSQGSAASETALRNRHIEPWLRKSRSRSLPNPRANPRPGLFVVVSMCGNTMDLLSLHLPKPPYVVRASERHRCQFGLPVACRPARKS